MNESRIYSAATSKLAFAQAFTATPKAHGRGLRGRLHTPAVRRRGRHSSKV